MLCHPVPYNSLGKPSLTLMRSTQAITLDINASQPSLDLGTAQETSSENFVSTPLGMLRARGGTAPSTILSLEDWARVLVTTITIVTILYPKCTKYSNTYLLRLNLQKNWEIIIKTILSNYCRFFSASFTTYIE